jgi:hypothetical protein
LGNAIVAKIITIIIAFSSWFLKPSTMQKRTLKKDQNMLLPKENDLGVETKLNFYYDSSSNCWLRELISSKQVRQSIALLYR